jgi:hypothetical protein
MLYSIPPDILALSQSEQKAENLGTFAATTEAAVKNPWLDWWDGPRIPTSTSCSSSNDPSIWPIAIHGTEIGTLKAVSALTIQTQPDITIWAFSHASQGKSWCLRNYTDPVACTLNILVPRPVTLS